MQIGTGIFILEPVPATKWNEINTAGKTTMQFEHALQQSKSIILLLKCPEKY